MSKRVKYVTFTAHHKPFRIKGLKKIRAKECYLHLTPEFCRELGFYTKEFAFPKNAIHVRCTYWVKRDESKKG